MTKNTADTWYYIIVQNPEASNAQIVGYTDDESGMTFFPAFKSKESAQQCFLIMPKDIMNEKYEVQAIIKEDLVAEAEKNNYDILLLDDKGQVIEKVV